MTQQELFLYGYGEYKKAIQHIEQMNQVISSTKVSFAVENSKSDFDIVLQGMMLKVAIADNNATLSEIDYIKSIVDTGDVLQFLKEGTQGKVDVSWNLLKLLDRDTFKKLSDGLDKPLNVVMKRLILPYATLEVILNTDCFEPFKDALVGIMTPLCMIDDDCNNLMEKFFVATALSSFENCWTEMKGVASQQLSKATRPSTTSDNSLKSRFEQLKKTNQ